MQPVPALKKEGNSGGGKNAQLGYRLVVWYEEVIATRGAVSPRRRVVDRPWKQLTGASPVMTPSITVGAASDACLVVARVHGCVLMGDGG